MMFSCRGFSLALGDFFFFPFTIGGCMSGQSRIREKGVHGVDVMPTKHWGQSQGSPQHLGMARAVWYLHHACYFLRFLLHSLSPG